MNSVSTTPKQSLRSLFRDRLFWRIYVIWFFRRIVPLVVIQIAFLALVLTLFADSVFISKVLENVGYVAGRGYWSALKYLVKAFLGTSFLVQLAILLVLGLGSLLIRDIGRSVLAYKAMWLRK